MTYVDDHGGGSTSISEVSDADLVLHTRSGDAAAFGELWRRHYRSGVTVARSVTSSLDADDLVQEAYARIYQAILKGGGPTGAFRAYLFTSIRNTAAAWGRARKETSIDVLESLEDPEASTHATDEALDRSLTAQAFRSLPTRWQEVLWYSEIEGMKPAEISPLLGMKATAVAQLAFRAREGLREAWIQAHLRSVEDGSPCQWSIERLGAYARGNLGARDTGKVEQHLTDCARCTIVAAEAREVSHRLALVLLPLVIGVAGASAYLAALQGAGAPVAAVAAMPSGVVHGAVLGASGAGASGAGASSGTAGGSAGTAGAAAGGGGLLSGVGAVVGIAAAAALVGGVAVAAVMVPGLLAAPSSAQSALVSPAEAGTDVGGPGSIVSNPVEVPETDEVAEPDAKAPAPQPRQPAPRDDTTPGTTPGPTPPSTTTPPPAPGTAAPEPDLGTKPAPEPEPEPDPDPGPTDPGDTTDPGGDAGTEDEAAPGDESGGDADPDPGDTPDPGGDAGTEDEAAPGDESGGDADPGDGSDDTTDPGTDPVDPALPEGTPTIVDTHATFLGSGTLVETIKVSLRGTPGATIEALIGGVHEATAEVAADGTAVLTLRPTIFELVSRVDIRYIAGNHVGDSIAGRPTIIELALR